MNERENYLRVINGQDPAWVPIYNDCCTTIIPQALMAFVKLNNMIDMFGVKWTVSPTTGMAVEDPRRELMHDITEWRDWVHFPDLEAMNWKEMAEADLKNADPEKGTIIFSTHCGEMFIPLTNMMGFEDALCALVEDEEEIKAFNEAVCDYKLAITKKFIEYYRPDTYALIDDFANEKALFMSPETFNRLYMPYYKKMCELVKSYGDIHLEFHVCGKVMPEIIDELVSYGVEVWQSAQCINDICAFQKKYGRRLKYNGVWDTRGPGSHVGDTEEMSRQGVRDCFDKYAQNGTLIFFPGRNLGVTEEAQQRLGWILDEARVYGKQFYN